MESKDRHLDNLKEIRSIMEKSRLFLSLSGLSGIAVGIFGLTAMVLVSCKLNGFFIYNRMYSIPVTMNDFYFYFLTAVGTLALALLTATVITIIKSKKLDYPIWDNTSKNFFISLLTPLAAGGIFTLALLYYGADELILSSMLIFYGLSLINCSRYTRKEIYYLGYLEVLLGIAALFWLQGSLLLWGMGFGILNIVYGIAMHAKYER